MRFQDPSAAVLKYHGARVKPDGGSMGQFEPVPPSLTDGYDMNVLRIVALGIRLCVKWQDATYSLEESTSVSPYKIPGDHNVYPGEVVQLKADAARLRNQGKQELGVVQHVDARRRLAQVKWFDREVTDSVDDHGSSAKVVTFEPDSARVNFIPLNYISTPAASHPSYMRRGDFAIIIPSKIPPLRSLLIPGQTPELQAYIHMISSFYDSQPAALRSVEPTEDINCFGQIVTLDSSRGYVGLRFGALSKIVYRNVPIERVMVLTRDPGKIGRHYFLPGVVLVRARVPKHRSRK